MNFPNNSLPSANDPFDQQLPGAPGVAPQRPQPSKDGKRKRRVRKDKGNDTTPKVTRRVIGRQAKFALLFAVVAAVVAFLALSPATKEVTYVVRTTEAIPALSEVSANQFEIIEIDPAYLEDGAINAATLDEIQASIGSVLVGSRPMIALAKGQQVRPEFFSTDLQLNTPLAANERLVSIRADVAAATAGQIKPGDRVDVYAVTRNGTDSVIGLIVSNIEVVSVTPGEQIIEQAGRDLANPENRDLTVGELLPTKPVPGIYVLRVNALDVPSLFVVDSAASVYLALRGADATDVATTPLDVLSAVCGTNVTISTSVNTEGAQTEPSGFCL